MLFRSGELLLTMYGERFDHVDLEYKAAFWRILCEDFFQRYVRPDDVVVDLGAGSCEFINAIRCGKKLVVDLNPEVKQFARDAEVFTISSTAMDPIETESVDVVFTSNFFEHLPTKEHLLETLVECRRILRPGGKPLVLAPHIRHPSHTRYRPPRIRTTTKTSPIKRATSARPKTAKAR